MKNEKRTITAEKFVEEYVTGKKFIEICHPLNVLGQVTIRGSTIEEVDISRLQVGSLRIDGCSRLRSICIGSTQASSLIINACRPNHVLMNCCRFDVLTLSSVRTSKVNLVHVTIRQDMDICSLAISSCFIFNQSECNNLHLSDFEDGGVSTFQSPLVITDNRMAIFQFHLAGFPVHAPSCIVEWLAKRQ